MWEWLRRVAAPGALISILVLAGLAWGGDGTQDAGGPGTAPGDLSHGQHAQDSPAAAGGGEGAGAEKGARKSTDVPAVSMESFLAQLADGKARMKQRLHAAKGLGDLASRGNEAALAALLSVLGDQKQDEQSRILAAIGLRKAQRAESVDPLAAIVRDSSLGSELRKTATLTLGYTQDARAVPILFQALDDPSSPEVRYAAYSGLFLFRKDVPQEPILLKVLRDREQPQWRRARAALFLARGQGGESAVKPLIEVLLEEPRSRELTPDDPKNDVGQVYTAIMSKQQNVRAKIAVALGQLARGDAVRPILEVMSRSAGDRVFLEAARSALQKIETRAGLAPLLACMKDPDAAVRQQAVAFLGTLRTPESESALEEALKDENPDVRERAAAALADIRGTSSTPAAATTENGTSTPAETKTKETNEASSTPQ